ncbi:ribonuclease H-like domain-containing protein [Tanacetum coccineum]
MDDGVVNWGEHTVEEEETNHALMVISSNTELGEQEAKILAYTLVVKKLEAQIVTFQKQQLSLNEQLTFQANEIYAKDEKLKRYRRIGMKAVKEKEQLKKIHKVLFTETECLVVSPDFKMPDENQILLKVPRQNNMYSFDMKTPGLTKDYACLIAKATSDESKLWHRRSDNGTEFKNRNMLEFCGNKGIKQEYSNARTPQQNGVAERMNRTLIEAARTMLADSLLPTTFWAEAVNTTCYIFNRVRVTKPQNKTPYELLFGHKPMISYIRPFGCHVTILDTLSVLGKFDGKSDEGFLVGTSAVTTHAGISKVTNSAGTPNTNASEEEDEAEELIIVPTAVQHTAAKVGTRKPSTNSKKEECLTELQNLKTQEKEAYSTGISEDTPKILAF